MFDESLVLQVDSSKSILNAFNDRADSSHFWNVAASKAAHIRRLLNNPVCGTCIGIASTRSQHTLSDLVAILWAGCSFVPYDPRDPDDRVAYILENAGVVGCVAGGRYFASEAEGSVVLQESSIDFVSPSPVDPNDLAYIIYTSGSTGRPKGVRITHRSLYYYYSWFGSLAVAKRTHRYDFSTNLTFDGAITTSIVALAHGKDVVVCPEDVKASPRRFLKYLATEKIDLCKCTPSYFRLLLDAAHDSDANVPQPMYWLLTGEAMSARDTKRWLARHPAHIFLNSYGPTEATVTCSKFQVDRTNIARFPTSIPIDMDSRGCRIRIVDDAMQEVSPGVKGELCLAGPNLADGYQGLAEATQKSFWNDESGTRWYRTGDRVMVIQNGEMHYFGRLDSQVKIRGVRIELDEINHVITAMPEVANAKVIVVKEGSLAQLWAFVVPRYPLGDEPLFCDRVQRHLQTQLPASMTPQNIVALAQIPMNKADKVDVNALQKLAAQKERRPNKMLIASPLEMTLLQIWRSFLPGVAIGTDSNFFQIGGHSLMAMAVIDTINSQLDSNMSPQLIFQQPTIRQMAQGISSDHDHIHRHHFHHAPHGPMLVMIHPATGLAHLYGVFKPFFTEVDFYGLSNDRFGESERKYESIEAMAFYYLETIRAHRPHGPLFLGGYCTGGVVAFAMAQELARIGQPVDGIILIDSYKLTDLGPTVEREAYNQRQLKIAGIDPDTWLARRIVHELDTNRQLVAQYNPLGWENRCLFIQCKHLDREDARNAEVASLHQQLNGWQPYLSGSQLDHQMVDASHRTLFSSEESIALLGKHIRAYIASTVPTLNL